MAHLYITKQNEIWKTANKLLSGIHYCWHFFTETTEIGPTDSLEPHLSFTLQTFWNSQFYGLAWSWNSSASQISHQSPSVDLLEREFENLFNCICGPSVLEVIPVLCWSVCVWEKTRRRVIIVLICARTPSFTPRVKGIPYLFQNTAVKHFNMVKGN